MRVSVCVFVCVYDLLLRQNTQEKRPGRKDLFYFSFMVRGGVVDGMSSMVVRVLGMVRSIWTNQEMEMLGQNWGYQ